MSTSNEKFDNCSLENPKQIIPTFFTQTEQCERVIHALLSYIKALKFLREDYRQVSKSIQGLCPAGWSDEDKLKVCLQDQSEVLSVAESLLYSLIPKLKKHCQVIEETRACLEDFEKKVDEKKKMRSEFLDMKSNGRIIKQQEKQITIMLNDTDNALKMISNNIANRLFNMDESAYVLVTEVITKFEDVQKVIATENLEIIDIIHSLTKTLPKPKPRHKCLSVENCLNIINHFHRKRLQLDIIHKKESGKNKKREPTEKYAMNDLESNTFDRVKSDGYVVGGGGEECVKVEPKDAGEPILDEAKSLDVFGDNLSLADEVFKYEDERQAAHQQVSYERVPLVPDMQQVPPTPSVMYEMALERSESPRRRGRKPMPRANSMAHVLSSFVL